MDLDNNFYTKTVLMEISNAFDCIPHDLIIAKLRAYDLAFDTLTFLYSHLKDHKQKMKITLSEVL